MYISKWTFQGSSQDRPLEIEIFDLDLVQHGLEWSKGLTNMTS